MASITAGNRIIPSQCAIVGTAIITYILFPANTFVDPDGDAITYSAPSPWTASGRQLFARDGNLGDIKFSAGSRQLYGTPSAVLLATGEVYRDYQLIIIATSSDTSTVQLSSTFRVFRPRALGSLMPRFAVPKEFAFTASDATVGASVGTLTTDAPETGITTPDQYSIVWSSENLIGDAEGINRSPFSVNNSGLITVSGAIEFKTYYLWVRATYSPQGSFDTAYVTITSTVSSIAGYIGGIPVR